MAGSDRSSVFKKVPLILVCDGIFLGDCCRFSCIVSLVCVKGMGRCSYSVIKAKANGNTGWYCWDISLTVLLHLFFIKMWTEVLKCGCFLLRRELPGGLLPALPSVVELAAEFHLCTRSSGHFLLKLSVKSSQLMFTPGLKPGSAIFSGLDVAMRVNMGIRVIYLT